MTDDRKQIERLLKKSDIKAFLKEFNDSGLSSENYLKSIVAEGQTSNNLLVALTLALSLAYILGFICNLIIFAT